MEHGLPRREAAIAIVLAIAACKADQPALTDANKALDGKCIGPYADQLVDSFPQALANPMAALGAPDSVAVAMTQDAVVTVAFNGLGAVTDASGNDIRIHATVASGASGLIRVAGLDQQYKYCGTLDASTTEFDLGVSMLTTVLYVRVIDVSGSIQLDSVEAIHDMCR